MDLLVGVRKEGSRGGRGDFKWSDVASSQHRENYLGHSLMAPVGRWQQGRDLQWYSRNGQVESSENEGSHEERQRQAEIKKIKQAEEEALQKALGLDANPNALLQQADHAANTEALTRLSTRSGSRSVGKFEYRKYGYRNRGEVNSSRPSTDPHDNVRLRSRQSDGSRESKRRHRSPYRSTKSSRSHRRVPSRSESPESNRDPRGDRGSSYRELLDGRRHELSSRHAMYRRSRSPKRDLKTAPQTYRETPRRT